MAKKQAKKLPEQIALAEFDKKHPGDLTPAQQDQRDKLDNAARTAMFKKLATVRVNRALRAIEGFGKLANPNKYGYTPEQVKKAEDAFKGALGTVFGAFAGKITGKTGIEF